MICSTLVEVVHNSVFWRANSLSISFIIGAVSLGKKLLLVISPRFASSRLVALL